MKLKIIIGWEIYLIKLTWVNFLLTYFTEKYLREMINHEHAFFRLFICVKKKINWLTKLSNVADIQLRLVHRSFAYSGRESRTIFTKWSRSIRCLSGMSIQVGYLFRRQGRMLMQRRVLRNILGGLIGGSRSVGRSVAVVLFKKLNIETRGNTGHPFPREGKRIRLYLCTYMRLETAASLRKNTFVPYRLFSTVVSGKLSARLIDQQPFNVDDYYC